MPTARWISRTRHLSEWLSEKASGGSSQWTATISRSIAFTDGSVLQSSRRRTPEYGSPLTRSARPSRVAQPSLARGRSIALTSSGGSNPDAEFMPLEYKPCWRANLAALAHRLDSTSRWRDRPKLEAALQDETTLLHGAGVG